MALENDDAAMSLGTVATATAGEMPRKISSGVIRNSAADAEHAGDESDRHAKAEEDEDIDRQVRDRKVELHGAGLQAARSGEEPSTTPIMAISIPPASRSDAQRRRTAAP